MKSESRRMKVSINHKHYIVVGNKSNEHIKAAASIVDDYFKQLKKETNLTDEQRATLVALNTASKQIELEKELMHLQKRVKQLEQTVEDLKNPEKVLARGLQPKKALTEMSEQMSLDEFEVTEFEGKLVNGSLKQDTDYVPAILNKKH